MDEYRRPVRPLLWLGLFALLYALLYCCIGLHFLPGDDLARREGALFGRVKQVSGSAVLLKDAVFICEGENFSLGGVRLWGAHPDELLPGQTLSCRATLRPIANKYNPGAFDARRYLFSKGVRYEAQAEDSLSVQGQPQALALFRQRLLDRVDALWPDESGVLRALLLGADGLDENLEQSYRRAGVSHVLAVSGLHVGFVAALLSLLLCFLPKASLPRFVCLCAGLVFYCLLTGASASTQRAALMAALLLLARVNGREADGLSSLSLAFGVLLLISPRQLLDVGFQLSFTAMLGIVLLFSRFQRWLRFLPKPIATPLALTLAAQTGCLPVLLCCFGSVSPYAPLVNLLTVPLAGLAVPLGLLTLLLDAVLPGAAQLTAVLCRLCVSCMNLCVEAAAGLPCAQLYLPKLPAALVLLWPALLLVLCESAPRLKKVGLPVLAAACALVLALWLPGLFPRDLQLTFLSVGCADSAILHKGTTTLVIDTGRSGYEALYALQAEDPTVEMLLLTHADADHSGGAERLLSDARVRCLCYPSGMEKEEDLAQLFALAKAQGCALQPLAAGDTLRYDTIVLRVLSPAEYRVDHSNEDSLVLELIYEDYSALLPADAGQKTLSALELPQADVLKLPHHGSADGLSAEQVAQIAPSLAVLSVGGNPYDLPRDSALEALGTVPLKRTDENGAVRILFADDALRVKSFKPLRKGFLP